MSRAHVVSLYSWVMPEQNAEMFVDQIFRAFDRDNNGSLDFHVGAFWHQHYTDLNLAFLSAQEFLKLTEFTEKGSIKDKLSWAFKVYDKDMSGKSGRCIVTFLYLLCRHYHCHGDAGGDWHCHHHGRTQWGIELWIFCTTIKNIIIFAQTEAAARVEYIFNLCGAIAYADPVHSKFQ